MTDQPTPQPEAELPPQKPAKPKKPAKAKKPAQPELKPKQALFVSYYTSRKSETFGNATRSAIKAGYGEAYARKITAVMSENVSNSMTEALDRAGLTQEALATKHLELSNAAALDQLKFGPTVPNTQIRDIVATIAGCRLICIRRQKFEIVAYVQIADHDVRARALDMAHKLYGHYAAEKHEVKGEGGSPVTIIFERKHEKPKATTSGTTPHKAKP
jgi:hypothetical protein